MIKLLGILTKPSYRLLAGKGAIFKFWASFILVIRRNDLTLLMHPMIPFLSTSSIDIILGSASSTFIVESVTALFVEIFFSC